MKALRDTVVGWVDERIGAMLAAPPMWGSPEAVELQVLLLLEVRALALRPDQTLAEPRRVLDTYIAHLAQRFPQRGSRPLHELITGDDEVCSKLSGELRLFDEILRRSMLEENPFQHNDLAIRLVFDSGAEPTMAAFTGYYEEFRRAARALARRGDKATGRVSKGVEAATNFVLADARVRQPNGQPADVLLLLGASTAPEQGTLLATPGARPGFVESEQVREALTGLITMGEWAAADAPLSDLPIDDADARVRLAVQARRLLPSRGIATAAIGGKLIQRSKPVELRAAFEPRLREVIEAATTPRPFDATDAVRAVDLDRGLILLGRRRLPCYVEPTMLGDRAEAGGRAHVVGQLFQPLSGQPFVLVDKLEIEELPADPD